MYVRWQLYRSQARNPRVRKYKELDARLKAVLVESARVGGQPRQKHIKFLGSVRLDGRDRQRFWYEVTTTLNRLGNRVSPDERKKIEAAIVKRVGGKPMTKAQLRQFDQNREGLLAILARAFPGRAR